MIGPVQAPFVTIAAGSLGPLPQRQQTQPQSVTAQRKAELASESEWRSWLRQPGGTRRDGSWHDPQRSCWCRSDDLDRSLLPTDAAHQFRSG